MLTLLGLTFVYTLYARVVARVGPRKAAITNHVDL